MEILLENLIAIIVGFFLAAMGILIHAFKLYNWIAGFNTMSDEQLSTYHMPAVTLAMRNTFVILGLIWILVPVINDLLKAGDLKWLIVSVLHIAFTIGLIVRINRNKRFRKH